MLSKKQAGSPCVDVCAIDDATGFCAGCYRTSEEIALWSRFTPFQRKKVLANVVMRRQTARVTEHDEHVSSARERDTLDVEA